MRRWLIYILAAVLCLPNYASTTVRRRGGSAAAAPSGNLLSETYDVTGGGNAGYDQAWTESNNPGNSDPDSTTNPPLTSTGFATQMLKVTQTGSARSSAWAAYTAQTTGTVYFRFYIYVDSANIPDAGEYTDIFELNSASVATFADSSASGPRIILRNTAGQLKLEPWVGGGGGTAKDISSNTGYRIEMSITIASFAGGVGTISGYEFKVDGTSIATGSGTFNEATNTGLARVIVGVDQNGNATLYIDKTAVGNGGFIGA